MEPIGAFRIPYRSQASLHMGPVISFFRQDQTARARAIMGFVYKLSIRVLDSIWWILLWRSWRQCRAVNMFVISRLEAFIFEPSYFWTGFPLVIVEFNRFHAFLQLRLVEGILFEHWVMLLGCVNLIRWLWLYVAVVATPLSHFWLLPMDVKGKEHGGKHAIVKRKQLHLEWHMFIFNKEMWLGPILVMVIVINHGDEVSRSIIQCDQENHCFRKKWGE